MINTFPCSYRDFFILCIPSHHIQVGEKGDSPYIDEQLILQDTTLEIERVFVKLVNFSKNCNIHIVIY